MIAVNLTSEKKGKLSFSCLLERGRFLEWSGKTGENTVMIRGSQGEGGVRYCGAISVTAAGGNVRVAGEHILVNNAGVSESTPFTSYTEADFDRVIDLNVKGVFNATRAVVDGMIKNHSGVVLNTSSMVSISGQPSGFAYPASKFAVNGTTISLARELGPKGIRVNAVAPGITETDMMKAVPKNVIEPMIAQIPLRRLGQPEDIANAFVFLASDEASYITGVVLSVDGMARA